MNLMIKVEQNSESVIPFCRFSVYMLETLSVLKDFVLFSVSGHFPFSIDLFLFPFSRHLKSVSDFSPTALKPRMLFDP